MSEGTKEALDYGDTESSEGFDVTEPVDVGDLSTQQGNDVIEPHKKVRFEIRKATVRDYKKDDDSSWRKKYLALDVAVSSDGVDGQGKYANKHFFQDLLLLANTSHYPELDTENYRTKARFDTKVFLKAMGHDPAKPPKINDDFLIGLTGREVFADITKRSIDNPPTEQGGKWTPSGEFRNEIKNWRAVEAS